MSTRIHPKNVHEKSPKKTTFRGQKCPREVTKKVSTRNHPLAMSTRSRPFWKKVSTRYHCPRNVSIPRTSGHKVLCDPWLLSFQVTTKWGDIDRRCIYKEPPRNPRCCDATCRAGKWALHKNICNMGFIWSLSADRSDWDSFLLFVLFWWKTFLTENWKYWSVCNAPPGWSCKIVW